ncbi:hypothetical protein FSP39_022435 [Pinctada imbricata]|uniref:Uncharacterized protein n=1 Tax=Pinctada imbricata TaxID=66713 RepID=A0AA89BZ89_PINIB|nr:hypothetical protein FSP39_022435 [Pinctada imbricata]
MSKMAITRIWILPVLTGLITTLGFCRAANLVSIVDNEKITSELRMMEDTLKSKDLLQTGSMSIEKADDQHPIELLEKVCATIQKHGAVALLDLAPPLSGQLLRSFVRTLGLGYITFGDLSTLVPADHSDLHIAVQPPGSVMLQAIPEIIKRCSISKVAILYDKSFDLDILPKRLLSGVPVQHLYQEIATDTDSLRSQLQKLKDTDVHNFFVVARNPSVQNVLREAQGIFKNSTKHLEEDDYWFVLTKDQKIACTSCGEQFSIILIRAQMADSTLMYNFVTFLRSFSKYIHSFDSEDTNVEEALIYDMMNVLGNALLETPTNVTPRIDDCYDVENASESLVTQSKAFLSVLKNSSREGVFGPIRYKDGRIQQQLSLVIQRQTYKSGMMTSVEHLGNWTEADGLHLNLTRLLKKAGRKTYRVVISPTYEPFVYRLGNGSYKGYCIDLLDKIRDIMGFDYTLYESPDGLVGSLGENGTWNGVIKELIEDKADIAVGPLSVMAERENVVDFTVPYYDLVGLTILMPKPILTYGWFRFIEVLDTTVWMGIILAFFLFSSLLCLFDRFSPFSYQNNIESWNGKGTEPRVFTMKEGIWFCMMSLTPQGGGEAPRALSGRLIAATWWLFGFIVIATYTANLAAFLTTSRLEEPIKSLDDLFDQNKVKYAPSNGSAALVYFKRMANIEETFYSIWKQMSLNDSLNPVERAKLAVWDYPVSNKYTRLWKTMKQTGFPNSLEEAKRRIATENFAYIGDAEGNRYQALTNCSLWAVGEPFSRKPFAFAVQEGSPLRSDLSNAILQLLNKRSLEKLKEKWWDKNPHKIECAKQEDESDGISIQNIRGVFLLVAMGTGMSLICLAVEFYFYNYRARQKKKEYYVAKNQSKAKLTESQSAVSVSKSTNGDVNGWPDITLNSVNNQTANGRKVTFDIDDNKF